MIDVLSKYAWAVPIKSKRSQDMIRGLESIYQQASPRRPLHVQTDQGKEFYNRGVQAWFKKQEWHHFSTYGYSKASVVERWHRTLKQRMYPYFTAHNTLRYVNVLQPLIHTYNHAHHRSIGMAQVTPNTVPEVWDRLFGQRLDPKTPPPPPPPHAKWAIVYASTRNIVPSKKAIYQDGRKKCLWSRISVVILWSPIDSVNGTAHL